MRTQLNQQPHVKVIITGFINVEKTLPETEMLKFIKGIHKQKLEVIQTLPDDQTTTIRSNFSDYGIPLKTTRWIKAPIGEANEKYALNITFAKIN